MRGIRHRGTPWAFESSFNEWHVLAISQAIRGDHRQQGIDNPLFPGIDSHALSQLVYSSAIEVLSAKYAECFRGSNPLWRIPEEAQMIASSQ